MCLREWSENAGCLPRSLQCGHSFCDDCLHSIFAKRQLLQCPTCNSVHKFPPGRDPTDSLPRNFSLLSLIAEKTSTKSRASRPLVAPAPLPAPVVVAEADEVEQNLSRCNGICETHRLMVHSYVVASRALLCDKCVSEMPRDTVVKAIPSVLRGVVLTVNIGPEVGYPAAVPAQAGHRSQTCRAPKVPGHDGARRFSEPIRAGGHDNRPLCENC